MNNLAWLFAFKEKPFRTATCFFLTLSVLLLQQCPIIWPDPEHYVLYTLPTQDNLSDYHCHFVVAGDHFYVALFSAHKQTHCAPVHGDSE